MHINAGSLGNKMEELDGAGYETIKRVTNRMCV